MPRTGPDSGDTSWSLNRKGRIARDTQDELLKSGGHLGRISAPSHCYLQDGSRGDSAVLVKRLEDQIKGLQREINMPSQDASGLAQLTAGGGSSSSP